MTGTRRRVGGDAFKVVISPRQSAHHLALRVKIHDGTNGAYTVSWTPPFSGGYLIHITLRGLPIFGTPFKVHVKGGGPYAYKSSPAAPRGSDKRQLFILALIALNSVRQTVGLVSEA